MRAGLLLDDFPPASRLALTFRAVANKLVASNHPGYQRSALSAE